ncbi:MAG: hypothetical protein MJ211_10845 [Bacteroidales bacterium]|nr:hypothetical protein [Bacteroidales bacterium]
MRKIFLALTAIAMVFASCSNSNNKQQTSDNNEVKQETKKESKDESTKDLALNLGKRLSEGNAENLVARSDFFASCQTEDGQEDVAIYKKNDGSFVVIHCVCYYDGMGHFSMYDYKFGELVPFEQCEIELPGTERINGENCLFDYQGGLLNFEDDYFTAPSNDGEDVTYTWNGEFFE